jgi:Zn-dependent peptidase ImmA (M78 family)
MIKGERLNVGREGGMRFLIDWIDAYPSDGPVGKTWGEMQLWVQDTLVWGYLDASGQARGVAWNWIDLLEFLANAWPYLVEEEAYPINFASEQKKPVCLNELWGCAKLRLHRFPDDQADEEDGVFRDFLAVHDFSEALYGASVPKLLCLRRGNELLAATERTEWILPFADTFAAVETLGERILSRLDGLTDRRSELARDRWGNRNAMPPMERWQIATGLDMELLDRVLPEKVDRAAANDAVYRFKAAARMLGKRVSETQLRDLLKQINSIGGGSLLNLPEDLLRQAADMAHRHVHEKPAIQGYCLANMLREFIACEGRAEPQELLSSWGVSVREVKMQPSGLDAIALWAKDVIPTVLLNANGLRAKQPSGRRSTLAHEICHILVDRDGALPVVEALGGEVSFAIEQRAEAFAAEFLLPRTEAKREFDEELAYVTHRQERNKAIERVTRRLAEEYGVSHEVTAWQILNSGAANGHEGDKTILKKKLKSVYAPFYRD